MNREVQPMRHLVGATIVMVSLAIAGSAFASPDFWKQQGWKTDFDKATVPLEEILSGGPPRDGIPSIDDPKFEPASSASRYADREPVIVLDVDGVARAYPLSVLTWHEIVNDVIADRPVAVTYCPLCNASIVFDRRHGERVLAFGTTGLLRNSDLVMYDRQTESWWQQFTGEGIVGTLAGTELTMIPSRVVSFAAFKAMHPEGEVLVPGDPAARPYGRNPYADYDTRAGPFELFKGDLPEEIDPMVRVVVVRRGDAITAVTLPHLRDAGEIEADGIRLGWRDGVASALDTGEIAKGRDVGSVTVTDAESGEPLVHDVTFAFVVYAFHPDVAVLTEEGPVRLTARR
jgi:uncharacterized protein DUF3179